MFSREKIIEDYSILRGQVPFKCQTYRKFYRLFLKKRQLEDKLREIFTEIFLQCLSVQFCF